ncbi:hypothetical protein HUG17_10383 [Dermatophagoides farinae]|uniref:Uncharacterized protein n=1 Tax=Dermatophagoides farinae TaxID=6954 RepID=A0A9D4SCB0_DERFA|nr:SOSS complex subunit C homolog A-like [Dermatophagoides farinae]KAH7636413.1 hypothetical protein HUG17_10383 [Dermatophagoides farinae]
MNSQRNKVFDELKSKHLKQTIGVSSNALPTTSSSQSSSSSSSPSPFILSSGPVTGSSIPVPILPNQITPPSIGGPAFSTLEAMTPSQKAVTQAHQTSFGFYIPQDSTYNPILPVLPRYN